MKKLLFICLLVPSVGFPQKIIKCIYPEGKSVKVVYSQYSCDKDAIDFRIIPVPPSIKKENKKSFIPVESTITLEEAAKQLPPPVVYQYTYQQPRVRIIQPNRSYIHCEPYVPSPYVGSYSNSLLPQNNIRYSHQRCFSINY